MIYTSLIEFEDLNLATVLGLIVLIECLSITKFSYEFQYLRFCYRILRVGSFSVR